MCFWDWSLVIGHSPMGVLRCFSVYAGPCWPWSFRGWRRVRSGWPGNGRRTTCSTSRPKRRSSRRSLSRTRAATWWCRWHWAQDSEGPPWQPAASGGRAVPRNTFNDGEVGQASVHTTLLRYRVRKVNDDGSAEVVQTLLKAATAPIKDPAKKDEPVRPKNDEVLGPVGDSPGAE